MRSNVIMTLNYKLQYIWKPVGVFYFIIVPYILPGGNYEYLSEYIWSPSRISNLQHPE
jgi:hypothetical protein